MDELKPCPFCGAAYEKDEDDFVYSADHESWCPLRGSAYGGYGLTVGDSEEEIAAWNQRAERTCKRVTKTNERPGKTVFNQWYACSECGNPMGHGENFCASCGAKVVGD